MSGTGAQSGVGGGPTSGQTAVGAPERFTEEPDIVHRISHAARNTLYSAGFGVAFGASIAAMRRQNIGFYAVSMGMNYMVFGGTFFGIRECLDAWDGSNDTLSSAMAGSMAGGILTTIFTGSPLRGAQGALVWGGAAYCAQSAYDIVARRSEDYRKFVLKEKRLRAEDAALAVTHGPDMVPRPTTPGGAATELQAVTPGATLSAFQATQDSFHDLTPDEAAAARVAWVAKNAGNLANYGVGAPALHETPIPVSGYTPPSASPAVASDPNDSVPTPDQARRQSVLTNPVAAGAPQHQRMMEAEARAARRRARSTMAQDASTPDVSEEEVAAVLEGRRGGSFDSSLGVRHPFSLTEVDSHDDGWWEWLPIKMHTDDQMEVRLIKRLRQIERGLMRDDEYHRIEVGAMRAATEPDELRALRRSPQVYYPEVMRIPPPQPPKAADSQR